MPFAENAAVDVRPIFRRRDHDTPLFVLYVWRTSGDRRYTRHFYQSETTERRRNDVKAVRRVIADSIRLPMNHLSTNSLCGVRKPRAIGRKHLRYPLGARILTLVRLSILFGIFRYPSLTSPTHHAVLHLHI